jgi:hypothetical protein
MSDWRRSLRTFRPRFAAASTRHPGLRHVLCLAADAGRDELSGPPFASSDTHPMCVRGGGRLHPLHRGRPCGTARAPRTLLPTAAGAGSTLVPAWLFADGFFGGGDDLTRSRSALEAFDNLAAPAWRVLPRPVRQRLVVDPYLDPAEVSEDRQSWVLSLYALAWSAGPGSPLRADRHVYPGLTSGGHVDVNMEYWFRLPDPVPSIDPSAPEPVRQAFPPRRRGDVVTELLERMRRGPYGEVVAGGLEFPPDRFAAFLEPDVFLASALAIDALVALEEKPQDAARPPAPRPKSGYRSPKEPTRRVSLTQAAGWFKMDWRTLRDAMEAHQIAAEQFSARLWTFDLGDLKHHNPKALADADPERPTRRRRRRPKKQKR